MATADEDPVNPAPGESGGPSAAVSRSTTQEATADANEYENLDDLDLPPLRMHANRGALKDRLSASSLQIPVGIQQQMKRNSLDAKVSTVPASQCSSATSSTVSLFHSTSGGPRSRSRSPSLRDHRAQAGTIEHNSSFSSLEEFVDPDILYDKMGFVELDLEKQRQQQQHSNSGLTPVSERMSEDTLEDVHAFSDLSVTRPSSSVGGSSTVGGGSTVGGEVSSHVLEPLDEGDEDLIESDGEEEQEKMEQVILTNMERIALQEKRSAKGGDSPSLPTA